MKHCHDHYTVNARGYWIRVDDIAKKNDVKKKAGISATLTPHNRIDAKTVQQWQGILLSAFYKRERTVMNQEKQ